ncbi:hypothetical protein DCE93_10575 [Agromyces badenianii]|uniref:Uncharacterized protein n=1 Tax=Agromyces badenianii TaxID=2080742 RepID=A0A2S0X019_9MICO|nr:hypothetical protein DCE93_10575 [Agromyces badenianii]PWC05848.1 hypothetical protein DCE94_00785 [Agromyces badenianii]
MRRSPRRRAHRRPDPSWAHPRIGLACGRHRARCVRQRRAPASCRGCSPGRAARAAPRRRPVRRPSRPRRRIRVRRCRTC